MKLIITNEQLQMLNSYIDNEMQQLQESTWEHGFQQRVVINTDTDRVREILRENTSSPSRPSTLADKAIRLMDGINEANGRKKNDKINIIDLVLLSNTSTNEKKKELVEQKIKSILSQNKGVLNSFCSHVRYELKN